MTGFPVTLKTKTNSFPFPMYLFPKEYDFVIVSAHQKFLMQTPIATRSSPMLTGGSIVAVWGAGLRRFLKIPRVRRDTGPSSVRTDGDQEWVKGGRCPQLLSQPHLPAAAAVPDHFIQHHLWLTAPGYNPQCLNYNAIFLPNLIWIQV